MPDDWIKEFSFQLGNQILSSEAIFLYRPMMFEKHLYSGITPVGIHENWFKEMLNHCLVNSEKGLYTTKGSNSSLGIPRVVSFSYREPLPPPNSYKNIPENLLIAIDMGGLDRRSLEPIITIFDKFSRCAITSDLKFYQDRKFFYIPIKDESELVRVLHGAIEYLREKLPPFKTT